MRRKLFVVSILVVGLVSSFYWLEPYFNNSATQLGFGAGDKFLIVHADDLGLTSSTNKAFIDAKENGLINSASIMVNCRAFDEIAEYAKVRPEFDWGVHLTLTSEWDKYKWGAIAEPNEIPSLLTSEGYFYSHKKDVYKHANPDEVYKELKAQIDKAIASGIPITHLDSHMGVLYGSADFLRVYIKVGTEYNLPVFIPERAITRELSKVLAEFDHNIIIIDNTYLRGTVADNESHGDGYLEFITSLEPGINQILIHPALADSVLRSFMGEDVSYGALWRQKDYDFFSNPDLKNIISQNDIFLIDWKQLAGVQYN
ncbi:polysaccharide deacetylase family protein [Carboxylicivirga taeanensis]|uniref:polysaccharide deacetylase family protein n=1 Tax=Carboxylicivirga taeanensis TaxID=1416875 RepID=UPI003F6DB104